MSSRHSRAKVNPSYYQNSYRPLFDPYCMEGCATAMLQQNIKEKSKTTANLPEVTLGIKPLFLVQQ